MPQHTKISELDPMFKVRITFDIEESNFLVEAPLPDNFGVTVGSEFSAPFDANFISGAKSKILASAVFAGGTGGDTSGLGSKLGVTTKKFYSNPEPSEISFDLQFEAYYDARKEVMMPIIQLMAMSLGRSVTLSKFKQYLSEMLNQIGMGSFYDEVAAEDSDGGNVDAVFDFLQFVAGPPLTRIHFGNVLTLNKTYISSVAPQFSNILDANGYPMSATCSITAVLEKDPLVTDDATTGLRSFFQNDASVGVDWGDE